MWYNNLLESIEKSKENSLERLLFALGILNVGEKTKEINDLDFVVYIKQIINRNLSKRELENIIKILRCQST